MNKVDVKLNFMDEMVALEKLHCEHCSNITEVAIRKFVQTSPKLRNLNIYGCNVTEDFFDFLNSGITCRENEIVLKISVSAANFKLENHSKLLEFEFPDWEDYHPFEDDDGWMNDDSDMD